MLLSAIMRTGPLGELNKTLRSIHIEQRNIYDTFGISPWWLVTLLTLVTAFYVYKHLSKPSVKVAALKPKKTGLAHLLFEKRWHPFFSAVLIGLIALAAWPLSVATGREFGLGITGPSANIMQFLVTGDDKFINWGVFLVFYVIQDNVHSSALKLAMNSVSVYRMPPRFYAADSAVFSWASVQPLRVAALSVMA